MSQKNAMPTILSADTSRIGRLILTVLDFGVMCVLRARLLPSLIDLFGRIAVKL